MTRPKPSRANALHLLLRTCATYIPIPTASSRCGWVYNILQNPIDRIYMYHLARAVSSLHAPTLTQHRQPTQSWSPSSKLCRLWDVNSGVSYIAACKRHRSLIAKPRYPSSICSKQCRLRDVKSDPCQLHRSMLASSKLCKAKVSIPLGCPPNSPF